MAHNPGQHMSAGTRKTFT